MSEEKIEGFYICHDVVMDALERMKQSLEDVWSIEYFNSEDVHAEKEYSKLTFALATLKTFEDVFQSYYEDKRYELMESLHAANSEETEQEIIKKIEARWDKHCQGERDIGECSVCYLYNDIIENL